MNRRFVDLYGGVRPDTADLHERWTGLPEGVKRRHVRECLALLDAQVAIVDGRGVAGHRRGGTREIGAVAPSITTGWSALTIAVVCLAATGLVGVLGAFIAR